MNGNNYEKMNIRDTIDDTFGAGDISGYEIVACYLDSHEWSKVAETMDGLDWGLWGVVQFTNELNGYRVK